VSASLILGSLVPCIHSGIIAGCALMSVGTLRGSGSNVVLPKSDSSLYSAAGARVVLEQPVAGGVALRLGAEVTATLSRSGLSIDGQEIWSTPPVAGLLWLSVAVQIW